MSRRALACFVLVSFTSTACGVETLPAPAAPDKVVPQVPVEPGPPGRGEGRVVLDSSSGAAKVDIVLSRGISVAQVGGYGATVGTLTTGHLCASTPCSVNLPYGQYELVLQSKDDEQRVSSDTLTVGEHPSVFRHELGRRDDPRDARILGGTITTLGILGIVFGGAFVLGAAARTPVAPNVPDEQGQTISTIGYVTLGIGAGLTAIGLGILAANRVKVQPGSSVQWTPTGPATATPADGMGTTL